MRRLAPPRALVIEFRAVVCSHPAAARPLSSEAQHKLDELMVVCRAYVSAELPKRSVSDIDSYVHGYSALDPGDQGLRHRKLLKCVIDYTTGGTRGDTYENWIWNMATLMGFIQNGAPLLDDADSRLFSRKDLDEAGRGRIMQYTSGAMMLSLVSAPLFRSWSEHMRHGYSLLCQAYASAGYASDRFHADEEPRVGPISIPHQTLNTAINLANSPVLIGFIRAGVDVDTPFLNGFEARIGLFGIDWLSERDRDQVLDAYRQRRVADMNAQIEAAAVEIKDSNPSASASRRRGL